MQDVINHIEKVRMDASQQYSNFEGKELSEEQVIDTIRKCFAEVLINQREQLINVLNKCGFPVSNMVSDDQLIIESLKALQTSNKFRDELSGLISKCENSQTLQQGNKKNFASQQMGLIPSLNANNMKFQNFQPYDWYKNQNDTNFLK